MKRERDSGDIAFSEAATQLVDGDMSSVTIVHPTKEPDLGPPVISKLLKNGALHTRARVYSSCDPKLLGRLMLGADAIFGVSGEGDLPCAIVDKGVIQPPHLARWEGFPLGYVSVLSPTDYRAFIALIIERDLYENIPRVKFVAYEMNERVSYRWLIVETVQNFEAAFEAFVRSCTFYYGRQVIDIPSGLNYRQLFGLESWAMERYAIISEHNRAVDATKHEEVKKIKI